MGTTKSVVAMVVVVVVAMTPQPVVSPHSVVQLAVTAATHVTAHVDATVVDAEHLLSGLSLGY